MTDLDARPQVALVKKLLDAFFTCDFKNVELLISKNYEYHPLPESMGLPKEERGEHLQRVRALFSLFKKIEVCIQRRSNRLQARRLISTILRSLIMK